MENCKVLNKTVFKIGTKKKKKRNLATEQQQQSQLMQECLEDSAGSVPGGLRKQRFQ